jgi:ribosomal peptide maturation radical SAM protein 1
LEPTDEVGSSAQGRVLIEVMPWASPMFPGLGPALLRSILIDAGMQCDIDYGGLRFSRLIEGDDFFENYLAKLPLAEIAFTPAYFDVEADAVARRMYELVNRITPGDENPRPLDAYRRLVAQAVASVDETADCIEWSRYDVVGFSVMMQQTVPSLALAQRIKSRSPGTTIVFGGPNTSAPMGAAMLRSFPELDLVLEGEADRTLLDLVRALRGEPGCDLAVIPGLVYRREGAVVSTGRAVPYDDLESLPFPDYGPFFAQLDANQIIHCQPYLQMETSRGCWWGQRHHCSFCSLDDNLIRFRAKSHDRVIEEVLALSASNKYADLFPTDSIIDQRFYKSLLPRLGALRREHGYDFSFFFEAKSAIRREHAQRLRWAGVNTVQPGIESFSDRVLALMDKGSIGIRQMQCLKFLAEAGIEAWWNLIYRNPGERAEDYEEMIEMLPFWHHLPPLHLDGFTPMLLMRYSPYFERSHEYGIHHVRPDAAYSEIFPDRRVDVENLAFYFTFEHDSLPDEALQRAHAELHDALRAWRQSHQPGSLVERRVPGLVQVVDSRPVLERDGTLKDAAPRTHVFEGPHAELFAACDHERPLADIERRFSGRFGGRDVHDFLDDLVERKLLYRSRGDRLLTTPLLLEANLMEFWDAEEPQIEQEPLLQITRRPA